MKRMLMALAAVAGVAVAAGSARADWNGNSPPVPGGGAQLPAPGQIAGPNTLFGMGAANPTKGPDQYGLLPKLRKAFRTDSSAGCKNCGGSGGPAGPGYPGYVPGVSPNYSAYPPAMQGTLVFPHHPFVRSPRDYFMYEPNK